MKHSGFCVYELFGYCLVFSLQAYVVSICILHSMDISAFSPETISITLKLWQLDIILNLGWMHLKYCILDEVAYLLKWFSLLDRNHILEIHRTLKIKMKWYLYLMIAIKIKSVMKFIIILFRFLKWKLCFRNMDSLLCWKFIFFWKKG